MWKRKGMRRHQPNPMILAGISRQILSGPRWQDQLIDGCRNPYFYEDVIAVCETMTLAAHNRAIAAMGGRASAARLTAKERSERARRAARMRWDRQEAKKRR
jgi:hypothetical protein